MTISIYEIQIAGFSYPKWANKLNNNCTMQKEFWNARYAEEEYAYGKTANDFLKTHDFLPNSRVLCLAEGEGRNAVHIASLGCEVTAVDISAEGIAKTKRLAIEKSVQVETICSDVLQFKFEPNYWDAIVLIFAHFPPAIRATIHANLFDSLRPGGKVILEAYAKEQLNFKTGGPQDASMLYADAELRADFSSFDTIQLNNVERRVEEGKYHLGMAAVIQMVAIKN